MSEMGEELVEPSASRSAMVVGVGTRGTELAIQLARAGVARLALVDPGACGEGDPSREASSDEGRPRVEALARRLRQIGATDVRALGSRVEDLPLGALRVDVIGSCLHDLASRRYVNRAAWRLGVPWVDGAADASGRCAQVNVYAPGPESACMECGLSDAREQDVGQAATTGAAADLALATAELMALECQSLLEGGVERAPAARHVTLDPAYNTRCVAAIERGVCEFDHETWRIEVLDEHPARLTLGEVLRLGGGSAGAGGCAVRVEGQHFAEMRYCPACCHHEATAPRLARRVPAAQRQCRECGEAMIVREFDAREWVDGGALGEEDLGCPLETLGVGWGDVLSVRGADGQRHFLLEARSARGRVARRPLSAGLARS